MGLFEGYTGLTQWQGFQYHNLLIGIEPIPMRLAKLNGDGGRLVRPLVPEISHSPKTPILLAQGELLPVKWQAVVTVLCWHHPGRWGVRPLIPTVACQIVKELLLSNHTLHDSPIRVKQKIKKRKVLT